MALSAHQLAVALRVVVPDAGEVPPEYSDILNRLLGVTEALVNSYAPAAPEAVKDEAQVRVAGYLFDRSPDSPSAGALYYSGAQGLLSTWRRPPSSPERVDVSTDFDRALEEVLKPFAFADSNATVTLPELAPAVRARLMPPPPSADGRVLTSTEAETIHLGLLATPVYIMRLQANALNSANAVWGFHDFTVRSQDGTFALPKVPGGSAFLAFAVPADAPDVTRIDVGGFNQIGSFVKRPGDTVRINGIDHAIWQSRRAWSARSEGQVFALTPRLAGVPEWTDPVAVALGAGSVAIANLAAAVLARMAPALAGNAGKYLAVNAGANAVELVDAPSGGALGAGSVAIANLAAAVLARMAPALAGNAGKYLAVNAGANAVELVDAPSGGTGGDNPFVQTAVAPATSLQWGSLSPPANPAPAQVPTLSTHGVYALVIVETEWSQDDQGTTPYAALAATDATESGRISTFAVAAVAVNNTATVDAGSVRINNNAGEELGTATMRIGRNGGSIVAGVAFTAAQSPPANAGSIRYGRITATPTVRMMTVATADLLARMAPALAGNAGKHLAVNAAADAVELVDPPAPAAASGGLTVTKLGGFTPAHNATVSNVRFNVSTNTLAEQKFVFVKQTLFGDLDIVSAMAHWPNVATGHRVEMPMRPPNRTFAAMGPHSVRVQFDAEAPAGSGMRSVVLHGLDEMYGAANFYTTTSTAADRELQLWGVK